MKEKNSQALLDLEGINKSVALRQPRWLDRVFWLIEKLLVPLSIAAVAYYGNSAATKIAQGQLALAETGAADRKSEFQRTIQSKYVELFYTDITSNEQAKQSKAIALAGVMEPELALQLLEFANSSSSTSASTKVEAKRVVRNIVRASSVSPSISKRPLSGYTVGIYYLKDSSASEILAKLASDQISRNDIGAKIKFYPRTTEFMNEVVPPNSLEIRYEDGLENRQAEIVRSALSAAPFSRIATLVPTDTRTQNFVSIFIPNEG